MAPKWSETASQRWLKCTKHTMFLMFSACRLFLQQTASLGQKWPHMAPRRTQDGPKMVPKCFQNGPKMGPRPQQRPQTRSEMRSGPIFCPFCVPRGPKTAPKRPLRGSKWPETAPKMSPSGPQNDPPNGRCLQKSLAKTLPARPPARLAVDLPVGTTCNKFLDGRRTLREAVTI